ncbi:MAG: TadE/TadG family type IV pilus assembly protein [Xanthobacteraceae bacterium]|uniref:TadE/TadG family type IV pilus assembly protein n=1 Tax=Pseudolabrys sp. TaxID=1960880 RepID=UPI003D0D51A0
MESFNGRQCAREILARMECKAKRKLFFIADRRGSSAVEFAIVLPIYLMLLLGVFAYGSYLALVHNIQQITAEAARASVAGLSDAERLSLARTTINLSVASYPFLQANELTLQAAATDASTGVFSVTISYDASGMFIFNLPNLIPMPNPVIVRTASIQRGGF